MIQNVPKSLDRPVTIFGVKGKWIIYFILCVGIGVVAGIFVGFSVSSGVGISVAIISIPVAFVAIYYVQENHVNARSIDRFSASGKLYEAVVRRETLSRILLDHTETVSSFYSRNPIIKKEGE